MRMSPEHGPDVVMRFYENCDICRDQDLDECAGHERRRYPETAEELRWVDGSCPSCLKPKQDCLGHAILGILPGHKPATTPADMKWLDDNQGDYKKYWRLAKRIP